MNKRSTGTAYEKKAQQYLRERGYRILASNYRCRAGEIDLVAEHGGYLVFIEVKYRADLHAGYGLEAVDGRKQRRILRAASWYLAQHGGYDRPCRFDVVSFLGEEITLVQDAFQLHA